MKNFNYTETFTLGRLYDALNGNTTQDFKSEARKGRIDLTKHGQKILP